MYEWGLSLAKRTKSNVLYTHGPIDISPCIYVYIYVYIYIYGCTYLPTALYRTYKRVYVPAKGTKSNVYKRVYLPAKGTKSDTYKRVHLLTVEGTKFDV